MNTQASENDQDTRNSSTAFLEDLNGIFNEYVR